MNIYIVVLHYGDLSVTKKCLTSLVSCDTEFTNIVVVNNDRNLILSEKNFSISQNKLHIINNTNNVGFAAGVNIGITYALSQKAAYVFLLNNDTIISKKFLQKLEEVLQKEKTIGIIGPVISFHKNATTFYDLGGKVNLLIGRTQHDEVENITNTTIRMVTYISGCCMLIRKEVFDTIGFFDEKFFLYYEDVDFCLRARQKGFRSAVLPTAMIYHELSKAAGNISSFSVYHQTKSGVLFGKKYCKIRLLNLLFLFAQSCLFSIKSREAGIGAFKGLRDGMVL